jgi:type IV pilus assembly protein PilX
MSVNQTTSGSRQHGFVLVASLLLLVVVTIMAVSMFRSSGMAERIAGNMREKQRALQAAVSAQQYAEWWLANGNASTGAVCSVLLNANANQGQVCSNTLAAAVANIASVPWRINGADVGVTYTPPNMTVTQNSAAGTYYQAPRFYISYLGASAGGQGNVFQIDAVGYGGGPDAVAVVESTYLIGGSVKNLGAL